MLDASGARRRGGDGVIGAGAAALLLAVTLADGGLFADLLGTGAAAQAAKWASAIIALGILIFIHELGHFLVAKGTGVGVERFSLGFGPRLWSVRRGETEYCVSAVPLGGYVKMVGEEAHGEEAIHPATAASREVRADPAKSFALKPLWTRALIVFAGPAMNFVLAAAIFSAAFAAVGVPGFPPIIGRVPPGSAAQQVGLALGDTIISVDGHRVRHWREVEERVARSEGRPLTLAVERDGGRREVRLVPQRIPARTPFGEPTETWSLGTEAYIAPVLGDVLRGRPASEAGLRPGDRVLAVNGQPIQTWDELKDQISRLPGQNVTLTIQRGGESRTVAVTPSVETEPEGPVGRIGVTPALGQEYFPLNPVAAVREGVRKTWEFSIITAVSLWKLVTRVIPTSQIGGPLQIGVMVGQAAEQGLLAYAFSVAIISINLAVLNLLPVPMLDGGHLLFFAIEAVLGRPLSVRKREIAQQVGLALLLLLMVFALGNDLLRLPSIGNIFR